MSSNKNVLILIDMDTVLLNDQGDIHEHLPAFLQDLQKNNILYAVVSQKTGIEMDQILCNHGIDTLIPTQYRFSYPDKYEEGLINFSLPDPCFYQYCAQETNVPFARVIGISDNIDTLNILKNAGFSAFALHADKMLLLYSKADGSIGTYQDFCHHVCHGLMYWMDRDDHHGFHIPDPTISPKKPKP